MKVHGNLNLLGNQLIGATIGQEDFPTNPQIGRFLMKGKILYICVESESLPVWVPLMKSLNLLKYVQDTPALDWSITHNLNCNYPIVQVFDTDGEVVIPDSINCGTFNTVTISFSTPTAGVAIIQRGEEDGSEPVIYAYENDYTNSDTWVVNHNLGYHPIIQCVIGTDEVQPLNIVHNSNNQSTVTWSGAETGSVRCI